MTLLHFLSWDDFHCHYGIKACLFYIELMNGAT